MEVQLINKNYLLPGTDLYKIAKMAEAERISREKIVQNKQSKPSYDNFVRTTPRSPERIAQIAKRKKVAKKQRIAAGLSALGILIGIGAGTGLGMKNNNNMPNTVIAETIEEEDNSQQPAETTQSEEEARLKAEEEARLKAEEEARLKAEEEARLKAEEEARLKAEEEARLKAEEEARLKAEEEARLKAEEEARLKAEEEARLQAQNKELTPERIAELHKILDENPDIREAYNNMLSALRTFSKQIGQNGIELIKKYVDELGDGKVDVTDVYKVLFIESGGRIYDSKGNYLTSTGKAYGPFQIRKIAETDINQRYGTNYDVLDPFDNLAVHVRLLSWLYGFKSSQLANGKSLPTGKNLKHAVMWGYHDGAYASSISYYGQNYLDKYDKLSVVDQYPDLYILMEVEL